MKIFLASTSSRPAEFIVPFKIPYILESFYYIRDWQIEYMKSKDCKMFMLDSGAFTFMSNSKTVDFEDYLYKYINFINKYDIKYFFELDIDSVVGLKEVERYREILERETGKKSIPVWHKNRGKQYFLDMVKEYDYVAIGGIVSGEIKRSEYKYLPWFIEQAHKHNCKIHGLGFTNTKLLEKYKFDSVDSTAWLHGSISANIVVFNGRYIEKALTKSKNKKLKHYLIADRHNLTEWLKYVRYMDK